MMSNGGAYFTNLKKYWRFYCYKIIWRHVFVTNGTSRVPLLCYSSHFGPFFQVLPDDHLEKRFSDQQDFTEFIFWGIQILRRNILKTGKNGYYMHQNAHIGYFLAIFAAWTFRPLYERSSCQMNVLISPIWKNKKGLFAQKSPKIE